MSRRFPAHHSVALVTLALLTASCSGHSSRTAAGGGAVTTVPIATTPAATDPCELVTLAQAEVLAGGAKLLPGLGVRTDHPNDRTCTYTAPTNGPTAEVEVIRGRRAQSALAGDRNRGNKLHAVARIGHEAYEENGAIFFRKKSRWVAIRVTATVDPAVLRPQLEALARTITPKI